MTEPRDGIGFKGDDIGGQAPPEPCGQADHLAAMLGIMYQKARGRAAASR